MKARDGHRFILVVTLPSNEKYALGSIDGNIALTPLQQEGVLRGLIAWECTDSMNEWLEAFRAMNGELNWQKWISLNPEIGEVRLTQ